MRRKRQRSGSEMHPPVRLTAEEHLAAKQAASASGTTLGTFIAEAVLNAVEPPEVSAYRDQRLAEIESELPKSAKAKLATFQKKLEQEFEYRVQREVHKRLTELGIPAFHKRLDAVEQMLTWPRNTVMTREEYITILKCLHPDALHSRTDTQLAEAFRIFTHYKLKMAPEAADRREVFNGMPRTVEEMMARKAAVQEQRRQARQKTKEAQT